MVIYSSETVAFKVVEKKGFMGNAVKLFAFETVVTNASKIA